MLRRTALAALLALPLAGCVTYQVVDRGGFYELHDGVRHVPGHAGHGAYFLQPARPTVVHGIDRWVHDPWGFGPGSHWSWSSHIGWGWGSPRWGGSLGWGWGWHGAPHWSRCGWPHGHCGWPYWHRGWAGPGTVWVVPAPAPRPDPVRPMPKPRPMVVEATPVLPAPAFRDGPRQWGEPRRLELPARRFEEPPARFERPQRFEEPPARFERPQRFEEPPARFERPERFEEPPARFERPERFPEPRHIERAEPRLKPRPVFEEPIE
ncbi:MAG: hypothetical protein KGZ52_00460 [Xanthomonadaceae bacterium]|jgi:hypothetical protein|nr:hypothetical protein [Xanthomonadaceae bacterium]